MPKREFERHLKRIVKAFLEDSPDYEWLMDDMSMKCTDEQWKIVCDTLAYKQFEYDEMHKVKP